MKVTWLEIAKNLPCGQSTKIHCCSSTPSMMINHTAHGYNSFCFKCKDKQYESHGDRSIKDINRHKAELEYVSKKVIELPRDFTLDIPINKMHWFLQYGIAPELIYDYGIGWSDYFNRIVMPVYNHKNELTSVQMRAVDAGQEPKYLNLSQKGDNRSMFYSEHTRKLKRSIVVTEDILSAIKVGRICNAVAILSSHIGDLRALSLAFQYNKIYVWLDPDKAGRVGAFDAAKQLSLSGCADVRIIKSVSDPKKHTLADITTYLMEA